jgi:PAS domain S-box-containing protein
VNDVDVGGEVAGDLTGEPAGQVGGGTSTGDLGVEVRGQRMPVGAADVGSGATREEELRSLFPGDSEMAARMRAFDWAATPLGNPSGWPVTFRTACRICLSSRFPMIVWWGPDLLFFYNDAYLPLLGDHHPALARPGREVWTEIWHIIGPMLDGVLTTGVATWSEDLLLPMNRHGYWEETYWTYSYSPLNDDAGAVAGVFTAVSDTTERVVGERRLAVLRDLGSSGGAARSVIEACRLVTDSLGAARMDVPLAAVYLRGAGGDFALAASTLDGEDIPPRPDGPGGWPLAEAAEAGRPIVVRDVVERFGELPGGGWRQAPTEAAVLPLWGDGGPRGQALGVMVLAASAGRALGTAYLDFLGLVARQTEALVNGAVAYQAQTRRAEELAELDLAKTTFFANISHEFRTPLTLILGPVEELRAAGSVDEARLRTELDVVHRNALRLGKLVNTLLDFSRIEAGRMQASYQEVDLAGLTSELSSVFRAAIEKAGLEFRVDCAPLDMSSYVDVSMWEKIVLNLLSNAFKFTFEDSISVSLTSEDGHAVLRVADTGTGIAETEMPRLFERFHRIANARARSDEGSGIGLAMVRELVTMHGGSITAESRQGVGTTFTVRIPLGSEHLSPERTVTSTPDSTEDADAYVVEAVRWLPSEEPAGTLEPLPAAGHVAPARVLVADDNADMREYLVRLLGGTYRVDAVADGEAALRAALADPPDIVVSDVMMPHLDGLGLVAALRADPRTERVPVIVLSARAGQESSIDGLAAGADDYLVKPFEARELQARVRANVELGWLRNHHADWRAAMVDSLQEGFFVCDDHGTVVQINEAFAELLGYGSAGLPYRVPHPWWPDPVSDAEGRAAVEGALTQAQERSGGAFTLPFRHRDGRRVWIAITYNAVLGLGGGPRMVVGTIRDVTEERRAVLRETAQARLTTRLSQVGSMAEVVTAGLGELVELWQARRGLAVLAGAAGDVTLVSSEPGVQWSDLAPELQNRLTRHPGDSPLHISTVTDPDEPASVTGAGTTVGYPDGAMVVWLEWEPPYHFEAGDRSLFALLCACIGQAMHRAHLYDEQNKVALALQRSILGPSELPAGFAVRYEPAGRPLEVGGDWYDVVELDGGRIGVVVGDCVGRGLSAAVVMGQLRSACRALLLEIGSPGRVLAALDEFARRVPGAACTTVFCGILDPATGALSYSSAGHPPAIVVHADGGTTLLEDGLSVPLCVVPGMFRPEAEVAVPLESTLLLYTDGLVERRRQVIDTGIAKAAEAMRAGRDMEVEMLAQRIMTGLPPDGGFEDDVAVLIYRRPGPLEIEFPAEPARLAPARQLLLQWLRQLRLSPALMDDVMIAVGEACANSVEHGCRMDPERTVRLTGTVRDGELLLSVVDDGRWRPPERNNEVDRGRGLLLMLGLMRDVVVDPGPNGTSVHLRTPCR